MLLPAYGEGWHAHTRLTALSFKKLLRQLAVLVILFTGVSARANVYSQTVSLSVKDMPLEKVFVEIKKQTGYTFAYFESDLVRARRVSISVSNSTLTEVLAVIFNDQPLTYTIVEKVIVVKARSEKKIVVSGDALPALPIDVKGRVVNENGDPADVTITVKGTTVGTSTFANGEFILRNIDPQAILVITGVSIEPLEEKLGGRNGFIIIRVKTKERKLDEVQVIAYGTTSQRLTTGNTGSIKAAEIEKQPVSNPLLTLQGRVPGVLVTQATGVPGGGLTIRIQGRNNLISNMTGSDPLIIIDGVPYPSQNLRTFTGGNSTAQSTILGSSGGPNRQAGNPLSYINPADIERIDVLKDADATAIYGSRAANGAVLITTKKGKAGNIKVDVNLQQGWGEVAHRLDLLNSQQYMEMRREAKRNDNATVLAADYDLRGLWDTTRYTDWQKELIGGTAEFTRLTTGVSGGGDNITYLINGTYSRESTVFPGSNFGNPKGALHFNLNASSPNQRLRIQLTGSFMADRNTLPSEDFTARALGLVPVAPPLYNIDGSLNWAPDPLANGNSSWVNPLSTRYTLFESKTDNLISNAVISYRILPDLEIKSSFGYTSLRTDQFNAALDNSVRPEQRVGRQRATTFTNNTIKSWIVEPQISWKKNMSIGRLDVLLGSTIQQQNSKGTSFTAVGQPSDMQLKDITSASMIYPNTPDVSLYKYNAVFGRMNFNSHNKYLLNLTARRDGSSRFGANNLFNNFGAVGIGWIFSQEKWVASNLGFLSFGKIRGSYGTTGNDQIGNYQFMNLFSSVTNYLPYQERTGLVPTRLSNPYLEWEETRKLQVGMDLGFFNDKMLFTVNYVRNRSSNNLTIITLPFTTGFNNITDNLSALIQNTAWEFSLSADDIIKARHITWSSSFNVSIPKNKLLAFPNLQNSSYANNYIIGEPLSLLRMANYYGVNPLTGIYALSTNTNLYNTAEHYYGGFQNNINYKKVQLSILFEFKGQMALGGYNIVSPGRFSSTAMNGNQLSDVMSRWRKVGDVTSVQKFNSTGTLGFNPGNRDWMDASYVRCKNISLSYQLPTQLVQKINIQSLRIFANGQNVFTITRYNGLDPETLNNYSLPPLRMITIGCQAIF